MQFKTLVLTVFILILAVSIASAEIEVKLTASDGAAGDYFGRSVHVDGDFAIVGADRDDVDGTNDAGSAYIFQRSGGAWTQVAKLTAADKTQADYFGVSVSISGDNAIVGSHYEDPDGRSNAGSAYIFVKPGGGWADMTETAKLSASDKEESDYFGKIVSISGDNAIVGAYREDAGGTSDAGSAYIFVKPGGGWEDMTETAKLTASDKAASDYFGYSVSISGDNAIVGAHYTNPGGTSDAGSAYIFVKPGGGWENMTQTAILTASDKAASDNFGVSVYMSDDFALVGAYGADPGGTTDAGSAYLFAKPGGGWADMTETSTITASDKEDSDRFGSSVSFSGEIYIVGAYGEESGAGSVYIQDPNYGHSIPRDTYEMVGIPVTVVNGDPATLFGDDFGNQDAGSETWRVSRWSVANQEYERYDEGGGANPADFVPGYGYWMVQDVVDDCKIDIAVDQEDGHVAQDARYVRELESRSGENRGVNQLANPFHYSYDWRNTSFYNSTTEETKSIADAATANWINGYGYTWDSDANQYVTVNWTGEENYTIDTWEGFWLDVLTENALQFRFKPIGYEGGLIAPEGQNNPGHRDDGDDSWEFNLQLMSANGNYHDDHSKIGIASDASDDYDYHDAFAFTPVSRPYVQLFFPYDGDVVLSSRFTNDFRSNEFENGVKEWEFVVRASDLDGEELVLTWPNIDGIDTEYFPTLYDEDDNLLANLREENEYRFGAVAERHFNLRVRYAPESVDDNNDLIPADFSIISAYPNPFNDQVKISYYLPSSYNVSMKIFDLNAKLIAELVQQEQSIGQHQITWDAQGQSTGIYFVRLYNGSSMSQLKLMLLK